MTALFEMEPDPTSVAMRAERDEWKTMSADRRRTIRNQRALDANRHPVTGLPLLRTITDEGEVVLRVLAGTWATDARCGSCVHASKEHGGARSYWKCDLTEMSRSAASDIRVSWPACVRYEPNRRCR